MVMPCSSSTFLYPDVGILEGALSHLGSLLLKFFYGSCVDPTTTVDQVVVDLPQSTCPVTMILI